MDFTYMFYDGRAAYCSKCHKAVGVDDYMLNKHIENCTGKDYSLSVGNQSKIKVWRASKSCNPYQDKTEKDLCGRFLFLKDEIRFRLYTIKWHDGETIRSIAANSKIVYCYECRFLKDGSIKESHEGRIQGYFDLLDRGELFLSGCKDVFKGFQLLYGGILIKLTYTELLEIICSKRLSTDVPSIKEVVKGIKIPEIIKKDNTSSFTIVDSVKFGDRSFVRIMNKLYSKTRYTLYDVKGHKHIGYGVYDDLDEYVSVVTKNKFVYISDDVYKDKELDSLLLRNYKGKYPLLPFFLPYISSFYELLYKSGYSNLVDVAVKGKLIQCCDLTQTTLQGMFGLPKNVIGKLNDICPEVDVTRYLQRLRIVNKYAPKLLDVDRFTSNYIDIIDAHLNFRSHSAVCDLLDKEDDEDTIFRFLKYVVSMNMSHSLHREYVDYLMMRKTLDRKDLPIKAKNVNELHNLLVREYTCKADAINFARFQKVVNEPEYTVFATDKDEELCETGMVIVCPTTLYDLYDESDQMHNCVKRYDKMVIDGNSKIFFLRDLEHVNESLVTIEVNKYNEVVQAKAKYNSAINKKQDHFIRKWCDVKGLSVLRY